MADDAADLVAWVDHDERIRRDRRLAAARGPKHDMYALKEARKAQRKQEGSWHQRLVRKMTTAEAEAEAEAGPGADGGRGGDGDRDEGGNMDRDDGGLEKERTLAPAVLQALPKGRDLPSDAIANFCFPMGLEPKPISMQDSMSAVNSILFGAGQCHRSGNSFVFTIGTEAGVAGGGGGGGRGAAAQGGSTSEEEDPLSRTAEIENGTGMRGGFTQIYGVCVVQPRLVHVRTSSGASRDLELPRCYCVITRQPFFDLHFQVLARTIHLERKRCSSGRGH